MQSFQSPQYVHGSLINRAARVWTLIAGEDSPTPQRQYKLCDYIILSIRTSSKIDFLTTFMAEYCQQPSGVGLLKITLEGFRRWRGLAPARRSCQERQAIRNTRRDSTPMCTTSFTPPLASAVKFKVGTRIQSRLTATNCTRAVSLSNEDLRNTCRVELV